MVLNLTLERGRDKPAPLYVQIADQLERRIRERQLAEGSRLPTVRRLADELGVTPVTVQAAYGELQDRALVEAVVGRGTFVRRPPVPDPIAFAERSRASHQVLRDMARIERVPGVFPMAQGNGDAELRPAQEFMRCFKALEGEASSLLGYWSPQGCAALRGELAGRLSLRGIECRPDDLLVTQGVTQGLDLLIPALCQPGDSVLVETPTYLGLLGLLEHHGVAAIGVPVDGEGPDLDAIEKALRCDRPRFLYTVATFHNPTGYSMTAERRRRLLELAERYDLMIVEDDIYRDIAITGPPPEPLKALDTSDLVVYIDGFSKSLMPGLRVGYILPPRGLRRRLLGMQRIRTLCGPTLIQAAFAEFLRRGGLDEHLRTAMPVYRRRHEAMQRALVDRMPPGVEWTRPAGGYCTWMSLPETMVRGAAFRAAVSAGVAVAPGEPFLAVPDGGEHLRLSIGGIDERDIPTAVERLADALGGVLGGGAHAAEPEPLPLV